MARIRQRDVSSAERRTIRAIGSKIRQAQRRRITAGRFVQSGRLRRNFWKRRFFFRFPDQIVLDLETVGLASRYASTVFKQIEARQGPLLDTPGLRDAIAADLRDLAELKARFALQEGAQELADKLRAGSGDLLTVSLSGDR